MKSFWSKYKKHFIITAIALILLYVIVYLAFFGNGFLTPGSELEKKDWLAFLGAYLSFAGTVVVSLIAVFQSKYFADVDRERTKKQRAKQVQPIFSVDIVDLDSGIYGTAEYININDPSSRPKHKNVTLAIENVGEYPVRHVIVFDKYLWQLLKPNEKKKIQLAYSDSPDMKSWKKKLIEVLDSGNERNEKGIPKWFNICYEDIDGNDMFQTFELKDFDGVYYYSLIKISEA